MRSPRSGTQYRDVSTAVYLGGKGLPVRKQGREGSQQRVLYQASYPSGKALGDTANNSA